MNSSSNPLPPEAPISGDRARVGTGLRVLLGLAAFVIFIAGLRAAVSLVVPFLMATFLAILSGPPLAWLRRLGLPRWLALVLVLGVLCGAAAGVVMLVGTTVNQFVVAWEGEGVGDESSYRHRFHALESGIHGWLQEQVEKREWLATLLEPVTGDELDGEPAVVSQTAVQTTSQVFDLDPLLNYATTALRAVGGVLGQTVFILITTMFIVAEASSLPDKLRQLAPNSDEQLESLRRVAGGINQYMAIKTATSFLTGLLIAIGLSVLGVDFALLWGLLAFLLNYVPTFGSIIAAVPAVSIAVLQFSSSDTAGMMNESIQWWRPVAAAAVFLAVNMLIGYYLEPTWMGRGMGMSPLVVFVSLVFWGWVLGPVGMFISVPLTMTVQIALEGSDDTRWLAILMGSDSARTG